MTVPSAPHRTDRGYVVISDLDDARQNVQVSLELHANGRAKNVIAEYVGATDVVIEQPQSFRRRGPVATSTAQMEVFVDATDNRVHVAPVVNWDALGA